MSSSDAFALRQSGLNEFLFAPVGTEANGMTLSLVSVFARLGDDPWREAGRLAGLPTPEAVASLAQTIAGMPTSLWPLPAATTIAARLIALLPKRSSAARSGTSTSGDRARAGRFFRIGLVLVCVAGAAAFEAGLFTPTHAPAPNGGDVPSFVAAPH
jgi:hypothetical protein